MENTIYELTNPQKNIWYTEQLYRGTNINTICGTAMFNECIDFNILKMSIVHILKTHKSYSLKFILENNVPKQYFSDTLPNVTIIDFNSTKELENFRKEILKKPFNIERDSLCDIYIFKFPNNHGGYIINIHHLISDGWSLSVFTNEVVKNYYNLLNNLPLLDYETSYLDFINSEQNYLQSDKFNKDKDFWNNMFSTVPEVATLPSISNNKLALESCIANRKMYQLNKTFVDSIRDFCKKHNISVFNFFMAIFGLYIGRACNLDDFVIGTLILNRCNYKEKNCSGMFISTMPFKITLPNNITFSDFVSMIAKDSLNMLRHQRYPYQCLLDDLRKENKNFSNLYNILISYQITNMKNNCSNIDYSTEWTFNGNCSDPLNIHLYDLDDTGELNLCYDYQTAIYTVSDINSVHNRIINIIKQILNCDSILLDDIEIVTPEEKTKLLYDFNNTKYDYDDSLNVIDLFEKQVSKTPNKIALISNNMSFSYKELNEKANILAHHLQENCKVRTNDIVGIMLNRCPEMIIGLLAILKCGATYLPIDPEYPKERISYMLENSGTEIVLINSSTDESIPVKYQKINIELTGYIYEKTKDNIKNLNIDIKSNSLVYLIYTSGSTGKPKGVMLTHKNLHNFVNGMKKLITFSSDKVMVSLTTICFDIFGLELWCSLTSGLTLVLANEKEQNMPELLNKLCLKNHVNMIQTTPSRYSNLLEDSKNHEFLKEITDIMVGGEAFPKSLLNYLKEITNAKIYNMYGPTETTIWSTVKDMTESDDITIGKPIANTQCYILDKNRKLLPPYIPGELYIGGDGVSNGYLHRKLLTSEKFVNSPFEKGKLIYNTNDLAYYNNEGEIAHLGRTDFQVKIRGYRVELGEIENRIIQFPNISNAVVVANSDNKYLSCYYVSENEIQTTELISYLLKHLPNYMIPAYFKRLDKIPLTPNCKVDRKALPVIEQNDNVELAKTETQKIISNVLSNILHRENIDINTPFLSLGLDSLGLIQLQTALLAYNLNLTTQSFYRYPSIKKLAKRIDTHAEYYTEFSFQIPSQFKHTLNELDGKNDLISENVLGNVLLTGANGFIGVHVLHEILKTTDSKVYCFVRGDDISHSIKRLNESYLFYFNESLESILNSRVFVYNGQIVCDNFSLSTGQLQELSNNINTIIHTAAIVKHYGDFEQFKRANIDGTRRIAEFAYQNKKRLIHISSISVSGNYLVRQDNHDVSFTENDLYIGQHYTNNVYVNSKFDAEKVVYSYMEKGLVAQVIRLGILSGRYSDGVFQKNITENAFYSRIKSLVDLKNVSLPMLSQLVEFTPVDLCTKAIVLLAKTKSAENKVYHLYNHHLTAIENVINMLNEVGASIGILDEKDFEKYVLELSKDSKNNGALNGIINDISFKDSNLNLDYGFTVNISSKYTLPYLNLLGFEWPELTDTYLRKAFKYMKKVKYI